MHALLQMAVIVGLTLAIAVCAGIVIYLIGSMVGDE